MISAPSEMRCRSMPNSYMSAKVAARTSGMVIATTRPARQPIEMNETISTMASASISASANSSMASVTTAGWSEICDDLDPGRQRRFEIGQVPCGRPCRRLVTLKPGAMTTPTSTASLPSKRILAA